VALDLNAFLDTSVLVSGFLETDEPPGPSHAILDALTDGRLARPMTAWHCVLEFYSIATSLPAGLRLEPELAGRLVTEELLARFEIHDLPPAARGAFVDAIVRERITGGRLYDAHIVEVARLAGARVVVTDNRRHFVSLMRHGVRVLTAAEFAEEHAV